MEDQDLQQMLRDSLKGALQPLLSVAKGEYARRIHEVLERNTSIVNQDSVSLDFLTNELVEAMIPDPSALF